MVADQAVGMFPPWAGKFVFTIDSLTIGVFTEVSGLSVSMKVEPLKEGGQNQFEHKLPGPLEWPNLVFKRGITDADNFFEWLMKCSGEGLGSNGNKVIRLGGAVRLLDANGKNVRRWDFDNALPVKWTGPKLAVGSKEVALEELEVCHNGLKAGK